MPDKQYNIRQTASGSILIGSEASQLAGNYIEITSNGDVVEYISSVPHSMALSDILATHINNLLVHLTADQHASLEANADLSGTNKVVDWAAFGLHRNDKHVHLTADQNAALDANPSLDGGNKVVDLALLLLHENNIISHLTTDQHGSLLGAVNPLTAANPVVDKALLESAVLILNDNIDNAQTDIDDHKLDFAKHMGTDQNAAFDNANSPNALNPLATMNDMPTPPPPPDYDIEIFTDTTIGVKPTIAQCAAAFSGASSNRICLMKAVDKGWMVVDVNGVYMYEKLTAAI